MHRAGMDLVPLVLRRAGEVDVQVDIAACLNALVVLVPVVATAVIGVVRALRGSGGQGPVQADEGDITVERSRNTTRNTDGRSRNTKRRPKAKR